MEYTSINEILCRMANSVWHKDGHSSLIRCSISIRLYNLLYILETVALIEHVTHLYEAKGVFI